MAPNTQYWFVLGSLASSYRYAWALSDVPNITGGGSIPSSFALSTTTGSSWANRNTGPFLLEINATPVPFDVQAAPGLMVLSLLWGIDRYHKHRQKIVQTKATGNISPTVDAKGF